MKLPSTLLQRHHVLSRTIPAIPFQFSQTTSVQRQICSPPLLQFRPSSSSSSDDVHFQRNVRRLIDAQRAVDRVNSSGSVTIRDIIQRSTPMAPEERRATMDYFDAEKQRWKTVRDMCKEEVDRLVTSDVPNLERLMAPERTKRMSKFARVILDRAAEPSHGLTPDDLKTVEKAVLHVMSQSEKGMKYMEAVGFGLGAGLLYYVYTIFNWSP